MRGTSDLCSGLLVGVGWLAVSCGIRERAQDQERQARRVRHLRGRAFEVLLPSDTGDAREGDALTQPNTRLRRRNNREGPIRDCLSLHRRFRCVRRAETARSIERDTEDTSAS
jgi:hypothetical protein